MKISVVGSINMDMTVTAERIPKKGETLIGQELHYIPVARAPIRRLPWRDWARM